MTNERAVEILNLDLDILGQYGGETAEAYKMAIKALEAHPTHGSTYGGVSWGGTYKEETQPTDAVSRSELQKTMDSLPLFRFVNNDHEEADDYYNCESVDMVIRNLPSVRPKYTDEEIDKIQAVEQAYVDKMVELAVEETKERYSDAIEKIKKAIDEMTEIHSDGEFYIKNVDAKWIIGKYLCGGGKDEESKEAD